MSDVKKLVEELDSAITLGGVMGVVGNHPGNIYRIAMRSRDSLLSLTEEVERLKEALREIKRGNFTQVRSASVKGVKVTKRAGRFARIAREALGG